MLLLTQEQATAILAAERARLPGPAPPARSARPASVMVELLGYLGGTLAIVGAGLLAARCWPDLTSWARLSLVGLVAVALGAGLATAIHAGGLWWRRPRPLQHLACLAGLAVAAGAGVALAGGNEAAVGLSVWAVGVGWVLAGWRRLLPPTVVALVAGGIVALQGRRPPRRAGRGPAWCSGWPARLGCWWRGRAVAAWPWQRSGSSGWSCSCRPRWFTSSPAPSGSRCCSC